MRRRSKRAPKLLTADEWRERQERTARLQESTKQLGRAAGNFASAILADPVARSCLMIAGLRCLGVEVTPEGASKAIAESVRIADKDHATRKDADGEDSNPSGS